MAKQADPTLADHLKRIVDAKLHSSYKPKASSAPNTLELLRDTAAQLLHTEVVDLLPPPIAINYHSRVDEEKLQLGHDAWRLQESAKDIANHVDRMKTEPSDAQNRKNNEEQLNAQGRRFLIAATPFMIARQDRSLANSRKAVDGILDDFKDAQVEIDRIRDDVKKSAGLVSVSKHAETFDGLAKTYRDRARLWLLVTIGMAVVLLLAVAFLFYLTLKITGLSDIQMVQLGIAKLVSLSVLYFLLILSARTYRANSHLYAVNQHRASALQSFEAFVASNADSQTKSAVLLEATRCIYSHVSSGYLTSEPASSPAQLIEVLKAASE